MHIPNACVVAGNCLQARSRSNRRNWLSLICTPTAQYFSLSLELSLADTPPVSQCCTILDFFPIFACFWQLLAFRRLSRLDCSIPILRSPRLWHTLAPHPHNTFRSLLRVQHHRRSSFVGAYLGLSRHGLDRHGWISECRIDTAFGSGFRVVDIRFGCDTTGRVPVLHADWDIRGYTII